MDKTVITTTKREIVIRIPKAVFGIFGLPKRQVEKKKRKKVSFSYLKGAISKDPIFKNKSSIEIKDH